MTDKTQYNAYQKASHTVDEIKQVIMLYEGAINFIRQAKEAINEKNYEKRYNLINKAIAIVNGLNSCLEFNNETEETARALDRYYQDIDLRLLYINFDNDLESCDKVIEDLQVMLNAWIDVEKEIKGLESSPLPEKNGSLNNAGSDDKKETALPSHDNDTGKPEQKIEINI